MGTIDHPGFRDPGMYAWGEGACARASVFSSSARGDFFSRRVGERPTRGDATRRRGGAARGRTVVSFAAAFATFATSSGCASATRASRVSSSEDDPPERRGARSVASAGAGSSAAARGAATIAGDPRRAYRCFPALGGVEGCDPSTLRRAGGGAAGMSIASIEGRGAARGEVCGRAERRVRGTRPEVAAKTTTSDDGIDRRFREATSRKSETGGRFRLHYFKTVPTCGISSLAAEGNSAGTTR